MGKTAGLLSREKWNHIIDSYADMVYRLALTRTRDTAAAEDVFQEVFLRCPRAGDFLDDEEHLRYWLIRVTINCTNNWFADRRRHPTLPLEAAADVGAGDDDCLTEAADVYQAVMKLPRKYRTVIHLFYYEDLPVAEIARITGSREPTVRSQLTRGRELLRQTLKGVAFDV